MARTTARLLIACLVGLWLASCGQYGEPSYPEGIYVDFLEGKTVP